MRVRAVEIMRKRKWHKDPPPVESPEEAIAMVRLALGGNQLLEQLAYWKRVAKVHERINDYRPSQGREYIEGRIAQLRHEIDVHKYGNPDDLHFAAVCVVKQVSQSQVELTVQIEL